MNPSVAPPDPSVNPVTSVTTKYDLAGSVTIIANRLSVPVLTTSSRASVKSLRKQKTSVSFDVFSEPAASSDPSRFRDFASPSSDLRDFSSFRRIFVSPSSDPREFPFSRRLVFASSSSDLRESSSSRRFRESVDSRLSKILQKKSRVSFNFSINLKKENVRRSSNF